MTGEKGVQPTVICQSIIKPIYGLMVVLLVCLALAAGDAKAADCGPPSSEGANCVTATFQLGICVGPDCQPFDTFYCDGEGTEDLACTLPNGGLGFCDDAGVCYGDASTCFAQFDLCYTKEGQEGECDGALQCTGTVRQDTCTDGKSFEIIDPKPGDGLISSIISNVKKTLLSVSKTMFTAIADNQGFRAMVNAAATLFVMSYAILFTFGIVQITIWDFMIRLIKIGLLLTILHPNAWDYFNDTVVKFFNDGTDDIINQVTAIAFGGMSVGGAPFQVLDEAIVRAISAKMFIVLITTFSTGPYGPILFVLLMMSLYSFVKALMNALWVYIMALVLRTLLFGLAPLFLCCILFARTRHIYTGWLNQIISSALQPIFLFTFFAFFCQLIKAAMDQLLGIKVCWTEFSEIFRGIASSEHMWRFGLEDIALGVWSPYDATWGYTGPENAGAGHPVHPVGIMLPLTLWILADLAGRFNHVVIQIATDIANGATDLRMGGEALSQWMGKPHEHGGGHGPGGHGPGGGGGKQGKVGERGNAGGQVSPPGGGNKEGGRPEKAGNKGVNPNAPGVGGRGGPPKGK